MGRKRRVDRGEILDAVGQVILEHGIDGLSIDAVAKAAGIGKTSVLYDFGSRNALLAAFVERQIRLHHDRIDHLRQAHASGPDATMRAMLRYAGEKPPADDLVGGMVVAIAANGSERFRAFLSETFAGEMRLVEIEAAQPRMALLAYCALHGLFSLECFGFCNLGDERREALLADIAQLLAGAPENPDAPPASDPPICEIPRKSQVFS